MAQHGPRLVVPIDVTKKPREQKLPLHNRWHPDIPPVAEVRVGEVFRVEMVDFSGGGITKEYTAEDIKNSDQSIILGLYSKRFDSSYIGEADYGLEEGEIEGDTQGFEQKESCKVGCEEGGRRKLGKPMIFFVTNIPDGCPKDRLMEIFKNHGDIFDIYLAKKKDKSGRNFGFVKFRNVIDGSVLEAKFKNLVVDNNRLVVYPAKFDRSGNKMDSSCFRFQYPPEQKGFTKSKETSFVHFPHLSSSSNPSYIGALLRADPSTKKSIVISPSTIAFSNRHKSSLVGRVSDFKSLCKINSLTTETGFLGVELKYLGGFLVLLSFTDSNDAQRFLNSTETWNKWFSSLNHWVGQSFSYERIAWIRILGVPAHLWDSSVLDSIGNHVGKVIQGSRISWEDGNWSEDCIGVLVGDGHQIRDEINLKWRDKIYRVWIIEEPREWMPDCLEKILPPSSLPTSEPVQPATDSSMERPNGLDQLGANDLGASAYQPDFADQHPSDDSNGEKSIGLAGVPSISSPLVGEKLIFSFENSNGHENSSRRLQGVLELSNDKGSFGLGCVMEKCEVTSENLNCKTLFQSSKVDEFKFKADSSVSKRMRNKSSSPSSPYSVQPFNLSFKPKSKKRPRVDSDPFDLDDIIFGLNLSSSNPSPTVSSILDLNAPIPVAPVFDSSSELIVESSKHMVANLSNNTKDVSTELRGNLATHSTIGESGNSKGHRCNFKGQTTLKQKSKSSSKSLKVGTVKVKPHPRPKFSFPPSYPP